jgi:hypothetical protein
MWWPHRRKRQKRWKAKYDPRWYSTSELQKLNQLELELVSYRARPIHHISLRALQTLKLKQDKMR